MPPSFFALEFHSEFEYRYAAVRINSGDDSTTLCKNLVNFGLVIPEITRLECIHQTSQEVSLIAFARRRHCVDQSIFCFAAFR